MSDSPGPSGLRAGYGEPKIRGTPPVVHGHGLASRVAPGREGSGQLEDAGSPAPRVDGGTRQRVAAYENGI